MFDAETLGTIAQLGLGLAGFSGIALVLTRGGAALSRLERDRLGIMLGSSLGATFLALIPLVLAELALPGDAACRAASAVMAVYTVGFMRYYVRATLEMRGRAPELVTPLPFGSVTAGHAGNLLLQLSAAAGLVSCRPAFLAGLLWLLFHGAYQFGRMLFIRPRSALGEHGQASASTTAAAAAPESVSIPGATTAPAPASLSTAAAPPAAPPVHTDQEPQP